MSGEYRELLAAAAQAAGLNPPAIVQPEDRYVRLNGLTFHYLDWGNPDRPPVVLLHGGGLTAHTWDLASLLLRDRYHLVALDLRGHGDSEGTLVEAGDPAALLVEDTRAFLEHLGYGRLALVGMSLGGITAIRYAARHPSRLAGLVIVDVGPEVAQAGAAELERFHRDTAQAGRFEDFLERAVQFNPQRPPEHLRYSLFHSLRRLPDGRWTWKHNRGPRPDRTQLAARLTEGLWDDVRSIKTPALLLWGERSHVLTREVAERTVAAMPDARLVPIPRAGHTVQGDNPKAFAAALASFLPTVLPPAR